MEYCMWLDADDVILEKDRQRFREMKEKLSGKEDIVMLPYHTAFDEEGRPIFIYYRERLIKNSGKFRMLWKNYISNQMVSQP